MLIGISLHVLIQNIIWNWRFVVVSTMGVQATSLERHNQAYSCVILILSDDGMTKFEHAKLGYIFVIFYCPMKVRRRWFWCNAY